MSKEVKKVKLAGKEFPIAWGFNQVIEYCDLKNITVDQYNTDMENILTGSISNMRDLIWSALKDGARKAKQEFTLDVYDVGDLLEDAKEGEIADVMNSISDTVPDTRGQSDSKKKVTAKEHA